MRLQNKQNQCDYRRNILYRDVLFMIENPVIMRWKYIVLEQDTHGCVEFEINEKSFFRL